MYVRFQRHLKIVAEMDGLADKGAVYGRLPIYVLTVFLATIFELAAALAPNITALLILRFIAGLVSSAPLSNVGGT